MKNREETAKQFFDTGISADSSPFLQEEDKEFDELYDKARINAIFCNDSNMWSRLLDDGIELDLS